MRNDRDVGTVATIREWQTPIPARSRHQLAFRRLRQASGEVTVTVASTGERREVQVWEVHLGLDPYCCFTSDVDPGIPVPPSDLAMYMINDAQWFGLPRLRLGDTCYVIRCADRTLVTASSQCRFVRLHEVDSS
jgi:hypothetical protein